MLQIKVNHAPNKVDEAPNKIISAQHTVNPDVVHQAPALVIMINM